MLWQRTRGWDDINYVTPHGWTAAEVFLLLRDCLVREENGGLVIGSGIPESWMNENFEVRDMPTYFGKISFKYNHVDKEMEVGIANSPEGGIKSGLPASVKMKLIVENRNAG